MCSPRIAFADPEGAVTTGACGGSHVLSALQLQTGGNRWLPGPPPDRDGTQMALPLGLELQAAAPSTRGHSCARRCGKVPTTRRSLSTSGERRESRESSQCQKGRGQREGAVCGGWPPAGTAGHGCERVPPEGKCAFTTSTPCHEVTLKYRKLPGKPRCDKTPGVLPLASSPHSGRTTRGLQGTPEGVPSKSSELPRVLGELSVSPCGRVRSPVPATGRGT